MLLEWIPWPVLRKNSDTMQFLRTCHTKYHPRRVQKLEDRGLLLCTWLLCDSELVNHACTFGSLKKEALSGLRDWRLFLFSVFTNLINVTFHTAGAGTPGPHWESGWLTGPPGPGHGCSYSSCPHPHGQVCALLSDQTETQRNPKEASGYKSGTS